MQQTYITRLFSWPYIEFCGEKNKPKTELIGLQLAHSRNREPPSAVYTKSTESSPRRRLNESFTLGNVVRNRTSDLSVR